MGRRLGKRQSQRQNAKLNSQLPSLPDESVDDKEIDGVPTMTHSPNWDSDTLGSKATHTRHIFAMNVSRVCRILIHVTIVELNGMFHYRTQHYLFIEHCYIRHASATSPSIY